MDINKVKKLNIPTSPGCYKFLNKKGEIIYIGKAANLKSRTLSYWQKSTTHTPAKYSMLKQISKILLVETDSEIEALLLEANLIKKYQPPYNVVLRDDKRYVYIKISTEDEWPRIFMTRQIARTGKYFGPFTSVESVRVTLKTIRRIWPFRSCANLPKKTCLYFRIGKCPGMCEAKITKQEYRKIIKQIILFLSGKKQIVVKEMSKAIKKEKNDEKINILKYQLLNLNKVLANTSIVSLGDKYATDVIELAKVLGLKKIPKRIEGYDISNIFAKQATGSMVVFKAGEPDKNQYRKFKIKNEEEQAGDVGMLKQILERRFKNDWPLPDLIIVDGGKAQLNVVSRVLKKASLGITVMSVSKGDGLRSAKAPDKIFFPGEKEPLELPLASPALHIIKRVRDEAHRFAISYHRQLRNKKKFL